MNLIQILMTPSEVMNNILTFIFAFIEIAFFEKFFSQLLKIEITKVKSAIYIVSSSLIGFTVNMLFSDPIPYLINLITLFMFIHFMFNQNIKNTFIAIIFTYITIFISAIIAQTILSTIFKISYADMTNIPLIRLITSLLIYSIFYLISIILRNGKTFIKSIKPSMQTTVILNLLLGVIVIFMISYIFSVIQFNFPTSMKIITIVALIIYFTISMYSIIRTNRLEETTEELETEKNYNKTLSLLHDNIRCFKHDFNNIIQILGGYIDLEDMEGLKKYYKSLLKECNLTNNLNVLNPQTINNPSIYSLLNNKYYKAAENGVNINFDIFSDLSTINFDIYELSRILGILLDNAIEAAKETDEKLVTIIFRSTMKKQLFIIENSCIDNNISTTKIFEKGYSTKENNSGIGLWKVHKILAKNTDIDLFTTVKDNIFKQELSVYY